MRQGWRAEEAALIALGLVWVALAAFWAPAAVYIVDGFVYHAQIDAAARYGSFFIRNGYETYQSPALVGWLMRVSGDQITGQYPGLWGFIAAPAYLAGGIRGVMIFNALCAAGVLWCVRRMALGLTGDRRLAGRTALIFGVAGFFAEYAIGFWPHAGAMLLVTGAMAAVTPRADARGALVAGLLIGLGVNIRVDAVLIGAPIAAWLLAAAERPYRSLAGLCLGVAPGLVAATAVNWVKFGAASPFSYGAEGGATTLGHYAGVAPVAALAAAAALSLGLAPMRRLLRRPWVWTAAAMAAAAAIAATPQLRSAAWGWWIIFVDFQANGIVHPDLGRGEDGVLRLIGIIKKALFQSLPYAPAALVPAALAFRRHGRAVGFALATMFIATAPFALSAWYGGLSNNMRYLLPATPGLALLTALALDEARRRASGALVPAAVAAAVLIAAIAPGQGGRDLLTRAQIDAPNLILAVVAVAALAMLALPGATGRLAAQGFRGAVWAGLVCAFALGWGVDLQLSHATRSSNLKMAELTADLPQDALLIVHSARRSAMRMNRPPALTAQMPPYAKTVPPALAELIRRMFAEGRPVFAQSIQLAEMLEAEGLARAGPPRYGVAEDWLEIFPLTPP